MALVLANRVQETATANTTVSFTLTGAVTGFQTFAVIGDTNTTYYSATDTAGNWEVGLGTYSTTGPTLTRTTIYASSNAGNAVTFPGTVNVFVTYPSGRSVNLDASGNVSALGTVSSGTWQGSTVGVAYGGTGVTTSSGANSVMLRDANQNVSINRLNQSNTSTTAAGGTTALTAASSYIHTLVGTGGQTYTMPDATTLTTGVAFVFNNMATGTLTIQNYATGSVGTISNGGAGAVFLTDNSTTGGTWDIHAYLPEGVTFGTNAFNLGTSVISGGTWQGGTIQPGYGGTGLTTFTGANNALYSTGASTLTAGTLPVAAGGTGITAFGTGVATALGVNVGTAGAFVVNGGALGTPSSGTVTNLTGTASININGTVGATTPNTGAFTSVTSTSASGILTRAAATQDGVALVGRAGGTGSFEVTLTPTTLTADQTLTLPDTTGTVITSGDTGTVTSTMILDGTIVNADISASAAIAVSKLAASTISGVTLGNNLGTLTMNTSGTGLSGSTTYNGSGAATFTVTSNATNANTASTIVARDASGNFSAGTITATLSGNATNVTGTVAVANGGTGSTSLTANNVLLGNGTSAVQVVAPGANGNVLTSNGTTWTSATPASASGFPAGTAMLFVQTAAPTGWTKSTTHNDKALRVVSGSASSGGTTAFSTVFANQTPTISNTLSVGSTTLTTSQIPSHTHTFSTYSGCGGNPGTQYQSGGNFIASQTSNATGGGGSHNHSISGGITSSAITLNVQYVDVIIATKD